MASSEIDTNNPQQGRNKGKDETKDMMVFAEDKVTEFTTPCPP